MFSVALDADVTHGSDWQNVSSFTIASQYPVSILACSASSCLLSILGALAIFITYYVIPGIRNFTRKLIICLTVADFFTASGVLISVVRYAIDTNDDNTTASTSSTICTVQSIITTYSSMVSFFFTVIIAMHIFLTVYLRSDRTGTTAWLVGFNLVSWIIPGVITATAWRLDVLGEDLTNIGATGPWCWVKPIYETKYINWMYLSGKGWEIACYLLTTTFYVLLKFHLYRRQIRERFQDIHISLRDEDKNLMYACWLVLFVLRIWGTVRFIMINIDRSNVDHYTSMRVLQYMQALGDPAQAFFNCIIFCIIDTTVRQKMCGSLCQSSQADDNTRRHLLEDDDTDHTSTRYGFFLYVADETC